ncbi:MAG: patatin-like phospholipase family protein [Spirochaetes bacterium]|nr:patatin-like phospholipase family protein [Spirochaetota bacterium]
MRRISSLSAPALFVLLLLFPPFAETAQAAPAKKFDPFRKYNRRPKVALVLSGGGAKGLAHVGVLKVIEETGLKIDYITGTSMGSIVGGLYASGYNARMLEDLVVAMDWDEYLADRVSRRSSSIEEKGEYDKYIGSFQIKKSGIQLPTGYKRGQKLTSLLSRLTLHVQNIHDFNRLPIPFRCVATDIVTGEAYVITGGYLPDAMRASMAIPSIFTPIEIDGKLLVDGGIVRNLPVSDARKMGADIVIAIDVGAPLYKKNELKSVINIMDQSVSFLGAKSTREQQLLADVLIIPDITGFSGSDFKRGRELIANGEQAARLALPELRELAELQGKFPGGERSPTVTYDLERLKEEEAKRPPKLEIASIDIRGLKRVSRSLVLGKLGFSPPARVTADGLMEGIGRVYASGFFERVTYEINTAENGDVTLIIRVEEMSGTFLKIGLSYDSDMSAAVLLNLTLRNLAGKGSKVSIDGRLSQYPGALLSYYIQTGLRKPGVGLGVKAHYDNYTIYSYKNGDVQSSYKYHNYGPDIFVQMTLFQDFALGVGIQKDFTNIVAQIAPNDPKKQDVESLNYYAYLGYDNLDRTFYPRSGFQFYGEFKYLTDDLRMMKGAADFKNFIKTTVRMKGYVPFHRRFSMYLGVTGGFIMAKEPYYLHFDIPGGWNVYRRKIPFIYENYVGGLNAYATGCFPFTGLNFMQMNGKHALVGDIGFQIEFWTDLFLILRGSVGRIKDNFQDLFRESNITWEQWYGYLVPIVHHARNDIKYGYGLTFAYNSIIGPIELTLMRGSESNKFLIHANIGFRL